MARRNNTNALNPLYEAAYPSQRFSANAGKLNLNVMRRLYVRVLSEIAVQRFTWVGLPAGLSSRYIEKTLLERGLVVFFKDPDYDRFFSLAATGAGRINMYDNPTQFRVYGNGAYQGKTLNARECVPIWPNYYRMPEMDVVTVFAEKLAQVDRTIDINLIQQRKPFLFSVPEHRRMEAVNVLKSVEDGEIAIFGNDTMADLNVNAVQAFNTSVHPQLVTNTQLAKQKIWNEAMTLLGVNNSNQDKRERLVADEVAANDEQIQVNRQAAMSARQEAVDAINQRWGLSIRVEYAANAQAAAIGEDMTPVMVTDAAKSNESGGVFE